MYLSELSSTRLRRCRRDSEGRPSPDCESGPDLLLSNLLVATKGWSRHSARVRLLLGSQTNRLSSNNRVSSASCSLTCRGSGAFCKLLSQSKNKKLASSRSRPCRKKLAYCGFNTGSRVTSSISVMPMLHTSRAGDAVRPCSSSSSSIRKFAHSGAQYTGEKERDSSSIEMVVPIFMQPSTSISLRTPSKIIRFSGFRSMCTRPFACRPAVTKMMDLTRVFTVSLDMGLSSSFRVLM
mmetsp:Transcript_28550/g.75918  ORF Transcript_28550/g.75918 Transcript_28550/m.75918 type:complete len:237 (+) Transcript_28550:838-1548(+)